MTEKLLTTARPLGTMDHDEVIRLLGELEALKIRIGHRLVEPAPSAAAPPADPPGQLLTARQVMERLNVSRAWLYRNAKRGQLPYARRVGNSWRFDAQKLERALAKSA